MLGKWAFILVMVAMSHATPALSDELTQLVQQDLVKLGYDPGPVDGHPSTKTIIAVSRFQSEHGLEVTGEITPQLAGIIQAEISKRGSGGGAAPTASSANAAQPEPDAEARREACLRRKVDEAQQRAKLQSGLNKLLSAVSRTASRYGGSEVASDIATSSRDASSINASVADLEGAAKDLGISQSDIDACKNA